MKRFRVGIDNYGLYPLQLTPLQTLRWAVEHGAEGVAFSGLDAASRKIIDTAYLRDISQFVETHDLYLEWGGARHIPRDMNSWAKEDIFSVNQQAAREAELLGARFLRSCSGGLMRWNPDNPSTETLLRETAAALKSQRQMLIDHNVILAIETHFEFTTHELLWLFELCEAAPGEYLGICLDTMNLLTMLEDPVKATERILPWVVSTHIKDGALLLSSDGLVTFPVEIGKGVVDLKTIISMLDTLERDVRLSVEDHGGDFKLPIFDPSFLSEFHDLTAAEFASLIRLGLLSRDKYKSGQCAIVERDRWGDHCEGRMQRGIFALKQLTRD